MTEDSDAGYAQVLISFRHKLLTSADATAGAADATAGAADATAGAADARHRQGTAALHFITSVATLHAPCWALPTTV